MTTFDIGFEWRVDDAGYQLDKRKPGDLRDGKSVRPGEFIIQCGGNMVPKKPMELRPQLFMDFALLDGRIESCLGFANKWGYLGVGPTFNEEDWRNRDDQQPFGGEDLIQWQNFIRLMHETVEVWKDNPSALFKGGRNEFTVTEVDVLLIPSPPDGLPEMRTRPRTLLNAMWLQLAGAVAERLLVVTCDQCGKWFGAGQRMNARFCSTKCRARWHNAKRRKAS